MPKPETSKLQIERDYDSRCAHAQSMFNVAVQMAESEFSVALALADEIRQAELAGLRHESHEPVTPTIEDVAMVKRKLDEPYGVTRLADSRRTVIGP